MKVSELLNENFTVSLANFRKTKSKNMTLETAIKIKKVCDLVTKEFDLFQEARLEAASLFADKDDTGAPVIENNSFRLSQENHMKLNEKLAEIINKEIPIETIKMSELGNPKEVFGLSTEDVINLQSVLLADQ